jgi:rhodanese-related sulfurtransferase
MSFSNLEVADYAQLKASQAIVLVDVRNDDEVARGIIADAIHIPLNLLPAQFAQLDISKTIVFYCHSGVRSAHAADFATSKGAKNVYNLTGGILAWGKAGFAFVQK